MVIPNNERFDLCKQCGGQCCQSMGCEVSTEDFTTKYGEITKESIIQALQDGEWAIDWWEGDIRCDRKDLCVNLPEPDPKDLIFESFYMRVRHCGEPAVYGSWGGTCVMWDRETGCKYDWDHRPTGGKALPAGGAPVCGKYRVDIAEYASTYDKAIGAVDWFPYRNILVEAIRSY